MGEASPSSTMLFQLLFLSRVQAHAPNQPRSTDQDTGCLLNG